VLLNCLLVPRKTVEDFSTPKMLALALQHLLWAK
jgi:hypothetical protein